jgi:hypothetical protein
MEDSQNIDIVVGFDQVSSVVYQSSWAMYLRTDLMEATE